MGTHEDMLLQKISVVSPPSADEAAQARRVVCANSVDSAEAEILLKMLGLL